MLHKQLYEKLTNKTRKEYDLIILDYIVQLNSKYFLAVEWFKYNYDSLISEKKFKYMYKLSERLNINYCPSNT